MKKNKLNHTGSAHNSLLQTVMIALFAALSYLALIVLRIPYPAPSDKPFIHLGNMIVILAALLIGGWQGGLSGSIGMGLFDIANGYLIYSPKTIILKFGIGFFTGLVARKGLKNPDHSPRTGLAAASAVSLILGAFIFTGKLLKWSKFKDISFIAYVFLISLGIILASITLLSFKFKYITNETMFAVLGAVAGITWNVIGEFIGLTIMNMIASYKWQAAMESALLSLPATFINGAFSIVGAMLLYVPLKRALMHARLR